MAARAGLIVNFLNGYKEEVIIVYTIFPSSFSGRVVTLLSVVFTIVDYYTFTNLLRCGFKLHIKACIESSFPS